MTASADSVVLAPPRGRVASRRVAFWLVAVAFSVAMLGTTLPTPLYVLYQQKLGFSGLMITVIFAAYAAGVLATLALFGRASDQVGRRPVLLIGLVFAALSAVTFLLAQEVPMLLLGRVLSGVSAGIFTGTATAALVDLAGEDRRPQATLAATAFSMGGLGLGPLLAGTLAQVAPLPLRLPYWVDLGLVAFAILAVWAAPETVKVSEHRRVRLSLPKVPPEVRSTFIPAATAGFAGFAVLGLFAAVAPSFLEGLIHEPSHALSGAVVFTVFAASTLGQLVFAGRFGRWALPAGCAGLIAGMALLTAALATESLGLVVAAAIVAGLGQGTSFRAGLQAVNMKAPAELRAGVASSFFIVMYLGISLPVIGEGIAEEALGLQTAGIAFSIVVAGIAAVALAKLTPGRSVAPRSAPQSALVHSDGSDGGVVPEFRVS